MDVPVVSKHGGGRDMVRNRCKTDVDDIILGLAAFNKPIPATDSNFLGCNLPRKSHFNIPLPNIIQHRLKLEENNLSIWFLLTITVS